MYINITDINIRDINIRDVDKRDINIRDNGLPTSPSLTTNPPSNLWFKIRRFS